LSVKYSTAGRSRRPLALGPSDASAWSTAQVASWCAANDVELVFTPSNVSWLNWIESEFTALRYFTLDGSDYPSHAAQERAIAGYLRWRNKHAKPKRRFAVDSKIRRPDYLANVA
jgi:hypothetical protein